jgi:ribonucleoside-diphosphate reductase alpha chain
MLLRSQVSKDEFKYVYDMCIQSNAGEPGFIWTNDETMTMGVNPCCEISLNPNQMCNLTTTSLTGIKSSKDLDNRIYASALLGTLQASYTDFPYLSQEWQQTTEREALLGCSFTGIADARSNLTAKELQAMAKKVLEVNNHYANKIGINPAARACAIKPEGTASCVLGSSSGIHARFGEHYLRRIRMNKDDSLTKYLRTVMPELIEDDLFSSTGVVVTIPQESPQNAIIKDNETALQFLDRVLFFNRNWIAPGHRSGINKHNVSATINYKPDETEGLFEKLWDNRNLYTGVSLLPFDGGTYKQAPFESCTKEQFDENNK